MTAAMFWDNVVAYSLQVGLVVGIAAFVPALLRLKMPRARLLYWHILLVACVMLPLMRAPQRAVVSARVEVTTGAMIPVTSAQSSSAIHLSRAEVALLLLAGGALMRLLWLGVGFWRLSRYRRHSQPLEPASSWSAEADLRICAGIASPVTFGYRHPVVLLPSTFCELAEAQQDAILCHEVLHIRRGDWLFTIAEELLRAVFWFHPAIWWLLGEIQLAREQAVDREVIRMTNASDEYVDALLAIAGAHPQLDLAPAPLFLRKRHLKQRVVSILKEVQMSKTKWMSALAVATGLLAGVCWVVTGAFPLAAAPQEVADSRGVSVELNGAPLMHRAPVSYPREALENKVQGTVVVQVKLNGNGEVSDAVVLSGPEELRKAAIQSVLNWHFMRDAALGTRQVAITFQLPNPDTTPRKGAEGIVGGVPGGVRAGVLGGIIGSVPTEARRTVPPTMGVLRSIVVSGLSDAARTDLLSRLPVREGDTLSPERTNEAMKIVHDFDSHLSFGVRGVGNNESQLVIAAPGSYPSIAGMVGSVPLRTEAVAAPAGSIRVGGNEQQAKLISQPRPIYPALAKQARISGTVTMQVLIGKDGHVENMSLVKGHPLLASAALDAVKDWVYEPTLLNGNPVEVLTTVDVNFTLSQ